MAQDGGITFLAESADDNQRLDVVIAARITDCSRAFAVSLINKRRIRVNGRHKKPGYRVKLGDKIKGSIPAPLEIDFQPEPIPLHVLYEDEHLIVVNKQAGLVVHPAPGHYSGTLVNAVLYHCPDLAGIGGEIRPGIVHRLDKNTTGTMVVAKNTSALENLSNQFKGRKILKKYLTLVYGNVAADDGIIKQPIGRHPIDRKRMSTRTRKGREAETRWRIRERLPGLTLLEVNLKTGRTHQIRVHCASMSHPVVGDPIYRPRKLLLNLDKIYSSIPSQVIHYLQLIPRQMLHAWRLGFAHPESDEFMTFESPIPEDMEEVMNTLRGVM
ncbi:MAG: RluA family pseudouridine synthase [Desulfobacterales bacterium]|jgi:23S rRNA pseudouridine1911/1915/1917 synthase